MLHDATYTQLKVQHNLQPRSLRIFLFLCKCCPFFCAGLFRYVFQWQFISEIRFQNFFFDGSLLWPQFFWHFTTWPFYTFLGGSGCVCTCVCVVDPIFSWCCPTLTASWCYPSGVLLFWHSRIVIAFIISLSKKTQGWFSWRCLQAYGLTICYVVLTFLACGSACGVWLMRSCFFWRYME